MPQSLTPTPQYNLGAIVEDGFPLDMDVALMSLEGALKAFFSTYQSQRYSLAQLCDQNAQPKQEAAQVPPFGMPSEVHNYTNDYKFLYTETIVHFHHFAELVCKQILRADHALLADNIQKNDHILYKLLMGQSLTAKEEAGLQSVEFSDALRRLASLTKDKLISNHQNNQFIITHQKTLERLNNLRNRSLHRGLFVLRYTALDKLVGKFILPFVRDALQHAIFSGVKQTWKYNLTHCGIDPIDSIINSFETEPYDIGKIALYKEIGRSAYSNPLYLNTASSGLPKSFEDFVNTERRNYIKTTTSAIEKELGYSLAICPVCGERSLLVHKNSTDPDPDEVDQDMYIYSYRVSCENCTFNVEDGIKNPREYGLTQLDDFWTSAKL